MVEITVNRTGDLSPEALREIHDLLDGAFRSFTDDDWDHTVGGIHVVAKQGDVLIAHAAVVPRTLVAGGQPLSTGYVEGVATRAGDRHRGHATRVMHTVGDTIARDYELGALSTGIPALYTPLGWESWLGPTYVESPEGRLRTAEEDDGVMVLRTDRAREIDLTAELTGDWRAGDVW